MTRNELLALERKVTDKATDPALGRVRCWNCRLTVPAVSAETATSVKLTAQLSAAQGWPLAGKALTFTLGEKVIGTVNTDAQGMAVLPVNLAKVAAGQYPLAVEFAGDVQAPAVSGTGTLTVTGAAR